ncbi:RNA polymerase factor sigma-54 [Tabrizicola sp.]|uniref:RNA polymerase factor sigma-54 n=1 Tax=Tabrizicola sp. TaxID=2005166 RepID=UPI0025D149A7|nr:RNA polymerase factor sigma-54 [Tabrizicola sp.]MBY0349639.1 RNA polymerase factor sigma-54 [Tabrizicola sp.]MDK2775670.1 RNA polymerase factor sigma-54 [Tabrizicola sp.]
MKSRSRISVHQTQRLALTTGLATSIRILRADAAGLSRYLEEAAAENPQILLARPQVQDWIPRWKSAFAGDAERPEQEAAGPSLVAHVLGLVEALRLTAADTRIAMALAEALEPSGWIGRSLASIAGQLGVAIPAVEAVLARLQAQAEPTGLFARNLAECLRLQAQEAGEFDPPMMALLDRLDLLAKGEIDRIAREAGMELADLRQAFGRLRSYDPKPGAGFEAFAAPIREPDLIAEKGASGWIVSLNRSALPSVSVAEGRAKGRAEARALIRMIEGRNATLLSVGQDILTRQTAALEQGLGALVPMTMAEIAQALGLHESTISRVVAGTAVDTPRGTWWLRTLFTKAPREGGPAAGALRDRLARLVANEDPDHPLSDEALAAALADGGAPIARRTVAKYRTMLNLPPAHRRRRRQ